MAEESRPFELELDFTDPFKRTAVHIVDGRASFGIWRPPPVKLDGDEERMRVPLGLEGSLDIISQITLGDRRYWPAIAQVNKIDFPLEEVKVGDEIIIPKIQRVRAAYQQATGRQS